MRYGSLRAAGVAAVIVCCALGARKAGAAEVHHADVHHVMRVGVVDFDAAPPEGLSLEGFLKAAADTSREHFAEPVDFEVVPGNYYQVLSWMKSKQLDAAVVSPMIAFVLGPERFWPLFELAEPDRGLNYHYANVSLRRATFDKVTGAGAWKSDDTLALEAFQKLEATLCGLLKPSSRDGSCPAYEGNGRVNPMNPDDVELNMVSHLSTSGFVAPLIFIKGW